MTRDRTLFVKPNVDAYQVLPILVHKRLEVMVVEDVLNSMDFNVPNMVQLSQIHILRKYTNNVQRSEATVQPCQQGVKLRRVDPFEV